MAIERLTTVEIRRGDLDGGLEWVSARTYDAAVATRAKVVKEFRQHVELADRTQAEVPRPILWELLADLEQSQ